MRILKALTEDLGVKIVAFIVALFIWFNVSSQEETTRTFSFPIVLLNMPDTLVVTGRVPKEAQVSITATKRQIWYLRLKKTNVVASLTGASPGRYRQVLSVSNVLLPPGINPNKVRVVSPSAIDLFFDRKVSKDLPVVLNLSGSVPQGYLLSGVPYVEPETVRAVGAESYLRRLEKVSTVKVDLSRIREVVEKEVELDYDDRLVSCTPDKVTAYISVSPRGRRILSNVPPTVLLDSERFSYRVSPSAVSVTLEGPKSVLDTLTSGDVTILLDCTGKKEGRYVLVPEIIIPNGIEKFSVNVESLTVLIEKASGEKTE